MYRVEDAKVRNFYSPFYGHDVKDLSVALAAMRRRHERVVFLAGDSSLDNKYWFDDVAQALNGYEEFLAPQVMKSFDRDGSGEISRSEFLEKLEAMRVFASVRPDETG